MRCGCPTGLAFPHPSVPCIASLFLSRTRTGRLAFAFASSRHWLFPELLLLPLLLLLLLLLCSSAAHEQALEPHHTSLHLPDLCSSSTPLPLPRHIPYLAIRQVPILILIAHSLHTTCTGRDRQRVPPVLSQASPTHHAPPCAACGRTFARVLQLVHPSNSSHRSARSTALAVHPTERVR